MAAILSQLKDPEMSMAEAGMIELVYARSEFIRKYTADCRRRQSPEMNLSKRLAKNKSFISLAIE